MPSVKVRWPGTIFFYAALSASLFLFCCFGFPATAKADPCDFVSRNPEFEDPVSLLQPHSYGVASAGNGSTIVSAEDLYTNSNGQTSVFSTSIQMTNGYSCPQGRVGPTRLSFVTPSGTFQSAQSMLSGDSEEISNIAALGTFYVFTQLRNLFPCVQTHTDENYFFALYSDMPNFCAALDEYLSSNASYGPAWLTISVNLPLFDPSEANLAAKEDAVIDDIASTGNIHLSGEDGSGPFVVAATNCYGDYAGEFPDTTSVVIMRSTTSEAARNLESFKQLADQRRSLIESANPNSQYKFYYDLKKQDRSTFKPAKSSCGREKSQYVFIDDPVVVTISGGFTGLHDPIFSFIDSALPAGRKTLRIPGGIPSVGRNIKAATALINQALRNGNKVLVIGHSLGSIDAYNLVRKIYPDKCVSGIYVDPPFKTVFSKIPLLNLLPNFAGIRIAATEGIETDPDSLVWTGGKPFSGANYFTHNPFPSNRRDTPTRRAHLQGLADKINQKLTSLTYSSCSFSPPITDDEVDAAPSIAEVITPRGEQRISPGETIFILGHNFSPRGNKIRLESVSDPLNTYFELYDLTPAVDSSISFVMPGATEIEANAASGQYLLKVSGLDSDWSGAVPVTVELNRAPDITGMSADSAQAGEAVTLDGSGFGSTDNSVRLTNAATGETVIVDSLPSAEGTALEFIVPAEAAAGAYTLQVKSAQSDWSDGFAFEISLAPPVVSLGFWPEEARLGSPLTVIWTATNSDSCILTSANPKESAFQGFIGPVGATDSFTISNLSRDDISSMPDTLTLVCTGAGGTSSASARIAAFPFENYVPAITHLSAVAGESGYVISWSAINAATCALTDEGFFEQTPVNPAEGSLIVPTPVATNSILLICWSADEKLSDSKSLTLQPPVLTPSISLAVAPEHLTGGSRALLEWSSTNALFCKLTRDTTGIFASWIGTTMSPSGTIEAEVPASATSGIVTATCYAGSEPTALSATINYQLNLDSKSLPAPLNIYAEVSMDPGYVVTLGWSNSGELAAAGVDHFLVEQLVNGSWQPAPAASVVCQTLSLCSVFNSWDSSAFRVSAGDSLTGLYSDYSNIVQMGGAAAVTQTEDLAVVSSTTNTSSGGSIAPVLVPTALPSYELHASFTSAKKSAGVIVGSIRPVDGIGKSFLGNSVNLRCGGRIVARKKFSKGKKASFPISRLRSVQHCYLEYEALKSNSVRIPARN